ncbi:MAG: hypothetical protein COA83_07070 [Methylophaga sp.]|nr:MAG: hypothetical protein COA83_07070 [Methylophaga sp.]
MAYIQRDASANIVAIFDEKQDNAQEYLALDNPELISYMTHSVKSDDARAILAESDLNLVRVIEDLVYTLIDKKIILFTDLPLAAREKLVNREAIRGHLTNLDNLVDDNEGLL